MENKYYCYAYLREDGTPYYIGKGCKNRIHSKNHSINLPPKERRIFIEKNLTESDAIDLEIQLIKKYGRKDLGTGILRNKTNGGDKPPVAKKGQINRVISGKRRHQSMTPEEKMEWISRISAARSGNNLPTIPVLIVELNLKFDSIKDCAKYINGDRSTITKCLKGKAKTHRGYTFRKL